MTARPTRTAATTPLIRISTASSAEPRKPRYCTSQLE
jgi:hypothetical protein